MTPEEIGQIYDQGRDAVIDLVTRLLTEHQRQIATLSARVQALESQLAKDSHNSGKPPSSDGLKKPAPQSLRQKSGKRPGGQPGHPGATLAWTQTPDQIMEHRPERCAACGEPLTSAAVVSVECRQVHDLPPLRLRVTEHRSQTCVCPACRRTNKACFPAGVDAPVQYGPQVQALGVYLTAYQLLPFARSAQLLHDLLGVSLSPGTLSWAQQRCSDRLAQEEARIKAALIHAKIAHFDESGARVAGHLSWLHSASMPGLTHYAVHAKRGQAAMDEIGILPAFSGTAVHDGWASYWSYPCAHALCNAHHLRELTFLAETGGLLWAQAMKKSYMKRLLLDMKAAVDRAKKQGLAGLSPPALADWEERYTELIAQGQAAHPPTPSTPAPTPSAGKSAKGRHAKGKPGRTRQSAGYNLVSRLDIHRAAVLAFLHDLRVPFDNNLAERDIRMIKLRLKISGGFRTQEGADIFCRLRGYLSTMLKQGHQALAVLTDLLNGQTLYPVYST